MMNTEKFDIKNKMPCYECWGDEKPPVAAILKMITARYVHWNIDNLKRIIEVGCRRFIDEMQEKVENGFMNSDVITKEMVVTDHERSKSAVLSAAFALFDILFWLLYY